MSQVPMETPIVAPRRWGRRPLATLGKLTVVGLVGLACGYIYLQAVMIGMMIPPLAIFAVLCLVVAALVTLGWRWTPLLAAVWSVFLLAGSSKELSYSLAHPAEFQGFAFTVFMLGMIAIVLGGGIAAGVQNYRGHYSFPPVFPVALAALAGACVGAILVAGITASGVNAGVSDETLNSLPALTTANFVFDQPLMRVQVGEMVALRLENTDNEGHSFDLDEFNVHALMPSGEQSLALFRPTQAGTYTFYCAPHYDKATGEGMQGKLIVE